MLGKAMNMFLAPHPHLLLFEWHPQMYSLMLDIIVFQSDIWSWWCYNCDLDDISFLKILMFSLILWILLP